MSNTRPSGSAFRVAELSHNAGTRFQLTPSAEENAALAETLKLISVRKVRFSGEIFARESHDWVLTGQLGATVTQPCSVSLAPVTTRIDVPVRRVFQHDFEESEAPETEMREDDEVERLTDWIDPQVVMVEALSLALPEYPRAPGAFFDEIALTEPGVEPLRDDDLKPFAGLAALKGQSNNKDKG